MKILIITTLILLVLPAYLYAGQEILNFIKGIGKETNLDFEKPFWRRLMFLLNIIWLPILYLIAHILIIALICYNGYIFYQNLKLDIKIAWWGIKNKINGTKISIEDEDYEDRSE